MNLPICNNLDDGVKMSSSYSAIPSFCNFCLYMYFLLFLFSFPQSTTFKREEEKRSAKKTTESGCTVRVDSLPHRKWKEIKQQPGTAGPGNMLGSCLVSFHFLWAILSASTSTVVAVADIECPNCSKLALLEGHQMATIETSDFLLLT